MINKLKEEIAKISNPEKAKLLQRFFKTGKGEYGEGDIFLGISVPEQREIAKEFFNKLSLDDIQILLNSKFHEERLIGLLILTDKYKKTDNKESIVNFYLKNAKNSRINNWDLVDLSCHKIVGDYLIDKDRKILYELLKGNLWEKRIAVVSCFAFIRENDFKDSLQIAELLLNDKRDLIHKAVGWMLREVGKKDADVLRNFLNQHCSSMPRVMLRYSIEKFDESERRKYMTSQDTNV